MNIVVLIHVDSKVTNCWIKKQGSIKNRLAHEFIYDLLNIMEQYNIEIQTKWIKGKVNIMADSLSRDFGNIHPETTLNNNLYELICSEMDFYPEIDLFSNGFNSKCTRFCSSIPHTNAISSNALNISWEGPSPLYAFPPGFLLHKVAFKIYRECSNNMLFCDVSQETEPWILLMKAVAKQYKRYKTGIKDCQIVLKDDISLSAQPVLQLIVCKI